MSSSSATSYEKFDEPFARIYNESLGPGYNELALPTLEKLLLPYVPEGANILDLCCGTGQLSQWLLNKGYQVTGIDRSQTMLEYARKNAPNCKLILGDVRFFELPPTFHAVYSMGLGLNHILNLSELTGTFHNVYNALHSNGIFVFDLRLEDAHNRPSWNGRILGNIKDEYAWAMKNIYHPESREGQIYLTIFHLIEKDCWKRLDTTWPVIAYSKAEVQSALEKVGFKEVNVYDVKLDLALDTEADMVCFVCRKLN
ncbi:MAG: class I SAM-dependent methyltransferase [Brasilonema angustatum HA4187-MV1]|jgi:SAM-dependent methyltransferase|nr:class I SAM-dependent methyltransferase [Brasilonema angustatum HA4187-MV1]